VKTRVHIVQRFRCAGATSLLTIVMCLPIAAQAVPSVSLPSNGINFGSVNPYAVAPSNFADRQMTIINNGGEGAVIEAITFDSFATGNFSLVTHNCAPFIQPGASCVATLRFTPTGINVANYSSVYVQVAQAPYLFQTTLSGVSSVPLGNLAVQTANTTFGTQAFGVPSGTQVIELKNVGYTPVNASSLTTSTTNHVVTSNTCTGSIAPGGLCQMAVVFVPNATGAQATTITVPHDGTGSVVNLTGTGTGEPGLVFGGGGTTGTGGTNVTDVNVATTNTKSDHSDIPEDNADTSKTPLQLPPIRVTGRRLAPVVWPGGFAGVGTGGSRSGRSVEEEEQDKINDWRCSGPSGDGANGGNGPVAPPIADSELGRNVPSTDPIFAADPINAALGSKAHEQVDYAASGGHIFAFARTYQAQAPQASALVRQKVGPGWYSLWDRVVASISSTQVRVTRGDGSSIVFNYQGNGTWAPESSEITDRLTQLISGTSTTGWIYKSGDVVENYNYAGRLTGVALPTGEQYTTTYDVDRLKTITDPMGRVLTFNYDAKGRLSQLVDPAGGITSYSYDDNAANPIDRLGRLLAVTFPDGRARLYKYDNPVRKFALTSISTLEAGIEKTYVTFTYDATNGRAIGNFFGNTTSESSGTGRIKIYYNTDGSSVSYDSSAVTRDAATGAYNLITAGVYPAYATVKRTFSTIQGRVLPTRVDYSHICNGCANSFETFAYDANGYLTSQVDRRGVATTYTYSADGRGLVTSRTEASGTALARTVSTTWHPSLRVPTQVIEPTRSTNYTYDAAGRKLTESVVANAETRTTTYTYDASGRLASVNGPRTDVNDTTTYTYHGNGAVYQVTNPKGQVTTYLSYDAFGNPKQINHPDGTYTTIQYDARGRVTARSKSGAVTQYTYTTNGLLATQTDPYGAVTSYLYDDSLRLVGKNESNGEKLRYTLDNAGRTIKTETFDAQNVLATVSEAGYDGLGRPLWNKDANGKVTTYTYDANGNVTAVKDANNLTTSTQYDQLNRPILVTDPLGKSITTTYTPADKIASIKDPRNATTAYTYNGFGDQTQLTSPDTGTSTYVYNAAGQVINKTDSRGKTLFYQYDVLGRITQMADTLGGTTYTYDVGANDVGRLSSVNEAAGYTAFTYDSAGRIASRNITISGQSSGRSIQYARDTVGRVTTLTYPSGNAVGITYNQGRVTALTLNGAPLISAIEYFPYGAPESWLLGANVAGTKDYTRLIDKNSRIEKYSTPTGYRKLTFDNGGRITQIGNFVGTSTTASATQSFTYDNAGRLLSFSGFINNGNNAANINQTQNFTYDANGNRLTSKIGTVTSTYTTQATSNRLTSVTGGIAKTNTYDAAGNLTSDGTGAASSSFTYDGRGRMLTATKSSLTTNYLINYQGQRVKKSNSTETVYYVYDDAGHMVGEYDGNWNPIQELIWLGDIPIALRGKVPCLSGGTCTETANAYIWTDHLNTPREITRVNGSNQHVSLWKWDSLPFGETEPNAKPSNLAVMTFNHRFPGQYKDKETGLYQNWHRDYDPKLGRYVQSDPLGLRDGANTYVYVHCTPVSATDRTGLYFEYCSSSGNMYHINNQTGIRSLIGAGVAGNGAGQNNVAMQCSKDTGPLPAGTYDMKNVATNEYGKNGIRLTPRDKSIMCSRSGFWIHAGLNASNGCIDLSSAAALASIADLVRSGADTELRVIGTCQ
jgi:RHS repeat-associated protein